MEEERNWVNAANKWDIEGKIGEGRVNETVYSDENGIYR